MNHHSTIKVFVIGLILVVASCGKDPLIEPTNPLTTIIPSDRIQDFEVNDSQIVYCTSPSEVVVVDRQNGQKKYYHKFNSHVFDVFKIQKNKHGQIHIGDRRRGVYYYKNDVVYFIHEVDDIIGFDYQRQLCYQKGTRIHFVNKKGINQQISTLSFRFGGNAQTAMVVFNDTVWVGTRQQGLYYLSLNDPAPRSVNKAYQGNYENVTLVIDSNEILWSLSNKYLTIRKNGIWSIRRLPSAITATDIVVVNDVAYISSDKGVYRFYENQFEEMTDINANLKNLFVTSLSIEDGQTLWLGTGSGIYSYSLP